MAFHVKKRGKLTYYREGDRPVLSPLDTEAQGNGDLKIYFAGLTLGYSARGVLGGDALVSMDPHREIPLVFQPWEKWLRDAGLAGSQREIVVSGMHAFGCQPESPNSLVDPAGYVAEQNRLRSTHEEACAGHLAEHMPDTGVPVHGSPAG